MARVEDRGINTAIEFWLIVFIAFQGGYFPIVADNDRERTEMFLNNS
jgi:hypothetical protein